ncbi:MAG: hypothetical protein IT515_03730 [Burkholderiales bacterium]|nr:hypothetical protein [Burkholderiales bacterium]
MGPPATNVVLVIGSAPEAVRAREVDTRQVGSIVAINNAWRIRPDWTHLVHPADFPPERRPRPARGQRIVTHEDYVPANNRLGGVVYAGGTMVFSAAYWVLDTLRPGIIAFCGCDMIYDRHGEPSHFYGFGRADPLRPDPTLQSLEAKANRLAILAAREGCLCINLTGLPRSHLTFPQMAPAILSGDLASLHRTGLAELRARIVDSRRAEAAALEARQNFIVPAGDYWSRADKIDADLLSSIDRLWLEALPAPAGQSWSRSRIPELQRLGSRS